MLSCAPAFAKMVAEMALGHALAALRNIVDADRRMRRGEEKLGMARTSRHLYPSMMRQWVSSAMETSPGNCDCCWHLSTVNFTPTTHGFQTHNLQQQGIHPMGLEELLQTCDVTFVLAIPTQENRELLTRETLEQIKTGSSACLSKPFASRRIRRAP